MFSGYKKADTKQEEEETFDSESMGFGNEEFERFIGCIQKMLDKNKEEPIEIQSAMLVNFIKKQGVKRSLLSYALFHATFTANIFKELEQKAELYLRLMKKLVQGDIDLENLLQLEFLLLEKERSENVAKYVPTILSKYHDTGMISKNFIALWRDNKIPDINKNYFYDQARDDEFMKMAAAFIDYILDEEEDG